MPKVRRNIRPKGAIGGKYVEGFLGRGAVGRRGPCKDLLVCRENWPKNMEDLRQMLQKHGDTNGNLCENFYVDTGPAGLFSLHTYMSFPYIHVISFTNNNSHQAQAGRVGAGRPSAKDLRAKKGTPTDATSKSTSCQTERTSKHLRWAFNVRTYVKYVLTYVRTYVRKDLRNCYLRA